MKDQLRGLTELRVQADGARGQLERAESQLAAASLTSPDVAQAVRSALDDIVAVGQRISRLQQAISDQLGAITPPARCGRCRTELVTAAWRCTHCAAPIAQA
jgi:hypothetical protein